MIQRLAHWLGGVALNWFYSDVRVVNGDRIPLNGPILVAMNHQNALIDALLALWIVPRELRITAKATLGDTTAGALLMRSTGIIPLRRAVDDPTLPNPIRNRHAFEAMIDELRRGGAILVFPEGKSHNEPEIATLKTGLARAALRARQDGISGIKIIPIGITFEDKATPGTRVLAQVGESIPMDDWPGEDARELTESIAGRLRSISMLNVAFSEGHHPAIRRNWLVRIAARWGTVTHRLPIQFARRQALRVSVDPGEPAMYTMTFGFGAIILSYVVEVTVAALLFGWLVSLLLLSSLIAGAYWAAYANHPET